MSADGWNVKLEKARGMLRELESVAVAFSAGIDSTLVLRLAIDELGAERALAVTGRSPSLAEAEFEEACRLAESMGAKLLVLKTSEFEDDRYLANPNNRCFFCKDNLYTHMGGVLTEHGIQWTVNGANIDDLGDWRPGLQAAQEHKVRSPLAEAGMTKADIRAAAAALGLPNHDKPASPCLSSRIPYGHRVTPEKLRQVDEAERFLKASFGMSKCRVRHYGDFARIEAPAERVPELRTAQNLARLTAAFGEIGFGRIEIDPEGFRSGKLNDVIAFGKRQDEEAGAPHSV